MLPELNLVWQFKKLRRKFEKNLWKKKIFEKKSDWEYFLPLCVGTFRHITTTAALCHILRQSKLIDENISWCEINWCQISHCESCALTWLTLLYKNHKAAYNNTSSKKTELTTPYTYSDLFHFSNIYLTVFSNTSLQLYFANQRPWSMRGLFSTNLTKIYFWLWQFELPTSF